MKVYLVQHGNALTKDVNQDRPLSKEGRRDVEKIAAFIKPLNISMVSLWHSGKTRAAQTAEILAGAVKSTEGVIQRDGLSPNDDVTKVKDELTGIKQDIMIVSHLPFLSKLASLLISGSTETETAVFKQGSIVCLQTDDGNHFQLGWMVTPQLLG